MYRKIMNHLKLLENQAIRSSNHANLKKIAKNASAVATLASNVLNNVNQVTAIRRKAANIQRHEVIHRLGKTKRIGRFFVSNN
jgi:hypothetical protein